MNLKSKKMIAPIAVSLILVSSVGGTAWAAQGSDIVKKNVLLTENDRSDGSKETKESQNDKSKQLSQVNEDEAVTTAKNALETIFGVELKNEKYALQTEYFDKSKNSQSYEGKSIWTVSWNKKAENDENGVAVDFHSVWIDAETGEILSMFIQNPNNTRTSHVLGNEDATSKAVTFIQSNDLNKGAAIQEVKATSISKGPKKVVEVKAKLDNGKRLTVVLNGSTHKIRGWQAK